jgi:hypothetical protein
MEKLEALRWTLVVLGLWLASGTAISLSRHPHWYVRGWDFPRVLIAALAFAVGAAYRALFFDARWQEIAFLGALGAVVAYQVSRRRRSESRRLAGWRSGPSRSSTLSKTSPRNQADVTGPDTHFP